MTQSTPQRPWGQWYGLQRWRNRADHQIKTHPLCLMCLNNGRVEPAIIADHITPHRGEVLEFWYGPLQSLCRSCHSSTKAQIEGKGYVNDIGDDGWPLDDKHPVNNAEHRGQSPRRR